MKRNILIIVMSVLMGIFVIAALQTWEYALDHGQPVPRQVWAMFLAAVGWFLWLRNMPRERKEEIKSLIDRWTEE